MENQTRFDVNAAIENWRNELAAQLNLASDDRRELETHLRDAIAGFQQCGLNDEESFWLARRRVGQPPQLGEEFMKANPAKVWRARVFWMAVSLVGSYVFMTGKDLLASWLNVGSQTPQVQCFYLIPLSALVGMVLIIRRGKVPAFLNAFQPSWKPTVALFLILTATVLAAYFRGQHALPGNDLLTIGYNYAVMFSWLGNAWWPSVSVLILLLTLKRNRTTPKRA